MSILQLIRSNAGHKALPELIRELDAELAVRDGDEHAFYAQFNKSDSIPYFVLAFENERAIGCGAFKEYVPGTAEIKRMFVRTDCRGKGIAGQILKELETWAGELGFLKCILETGVNQPEAIGLYRKAGYLQTANYGQYAEAENSLCFEKVLV